MTTDAIDSSRTDLDVGDALLLRIGTVMRLTGLGRSTIYRLMADEAFPSPVQLTKRVGLASCRPRAMERRAPDRDPLSLARSVTSCESPTRRYS